MKSLKKIWAILISFTIAFITASIPASAVSASSETAIRTELAETDIAPVYSMATNILSDYYRSVVNISSITNKSSVIVNFRKKLIASVSAPALVNYIYTKQDYRNLVEDSVGIVYASHSSEFTLHSYKITGDVISMRICARVSQPYLDGEESGFGEAINFVFIKENGVLKIADWYTEDIYDEEVRGILTEISNPDFWNNSEQVALICNNERRIAAVTEANFAEMNNNTVLVASDILYDTKANPNAATVTSFSTTARSNMA